MTNSTAKAYIQSLLKPGASKVSFGNTMLRSIQGDGDACVGDHVEHLLKHGYDYEWNIFRSKCWQELSVEDRTRWYEVADLLQGVENAKSPFSKLVAFLDYVWDVNKKKWVPSPIPSIAVTIGGYQTQVNLTLLEQRLTKRFLSESTFNREYGITTLGPGDPAAMWRSQFESLARGVVRNWPGKKIVGPEASSFVFRFQWFYSLTVRMYDEARSRLLVFGNMEAASDLKILFSSKDSVAQEIHVDMLTAAFIVSAAASFIRGREVMSITPFAFVAATDVRQFDDDGYLDYSINDPVFSRTPWRELPNPPKFEKVVPSGQLLCMASSNPHGGPDRLIPEIRKLLPTDISDDQYVRFTLFQVVAFEHNAIEVRDSLSDTPDGVEIQVNFWNHLSHTEPGWHRKKKYNQTLAAMNNHDPDLINDFDGVRASKKRKR